MGASTTETFSSPSSRRRMVARGCVCSRGWPAVPAGAAVVLPLLSRAPPPERTGARNGSSSARDATGMDAASEVWGVGERADMCDRSLSKVLFPETVA
jgi:hypothetical protein